MGRERRKTNCPRVSNDVVQTMADKLIEFPSVPFVCGSVHVARRQAREARRTSARQEINVANNE